MAILLQNKFCTFGENCEKPFVGGHDLFENECSFKKKF